MNREGAAALKRAIAKADPADRYQAREYLAELEDVSAGMEAAFDVGYELGYELGVAAGVKLADEDVEVSDEDA